MISTVNYTFLSPIKEFSLYQYNSKEETMGIAWDPSKMATGVPAIDVEHQEWIRRYDEFAAAIGSGNGLASV
jgi:hypothetical protein